MMARQLLWVVLALIAVPLLLVLTAPELLGADASEALGLIGVVFAAAVPGIVLLGLAAIRRRRDVHDSND